MIQPTCKKCGGEMREGVAIKQTYTGMPDFPGDKYPVTMSPGGKGKIIPCLKCADCGWSMTIMQSPFPNSEIPNQGTTPPIMGGVQEIDLFTLHEQFGYMN